MPPSGSFWGAPGWLLVRTGRTRRSIPFASDPFASRNEPTPAVRTATGRSATVLFTWAARAGRTRPDRGEPWPDDGLSATDAVPAWRNETLRIRSGTICCNHGAESRLQRICTSNAQPGHRKEGYPHPGRVGHAFGAGVPDSPPPGEGPGCADAVPRVKNSPPSGAQTCTDRCRWGASSLVRGLVDWKRGPAACFDPSHCGGRSGRSGTDARCPRSRPSSVPRGGRSPLVRYPYEGKFHHELHPPG